jgi:hypothetical protein
MQYAQCIRRVCIFQLLLSFALAAPLAHAVPSFARQTGMACEACPMVTDADSRSLRHRHFIPRIAVGR